jgi:CheY-specific phosphatase CheX
MPNLKNVNGLTPRELLTSVIEAIPTAFKPMCGEEPLASSLGAPEHSSVWITAGIPFKGEPPWDLTLLLPEKTATGLTQAFVGFETPSDSPDMNDAVGELVNVLAGHVIERLESIGRKTAMTLPQVARGQDIDLHPAGFASQIFLNCPSPQGQFWIRISVKPDSSGSTPA